MQARPQRFRWSCNLCASSDSPLWACTGLKMGFGPWYLKGWALSFRGLVHLPVVASNPQASTRACTNSTWLAWKEVASHLPSSKPGAKMVDPNTMERTKQAAAIYGIVPYEPYGFVFPRGWTFPCFLSASGPCLGLTCRV